MVFFCVWRCHGSSTFGDVALLVVTSSSAPCTRIVIDKEGKEVDSAMV